MSRTLAVTVKLNEYEYEWFRRKAYWDGKPMATLLREHIHTLISEAGYLRPPDDEPQDFGYEKEIMQLVVTIQNERE